MRRATITCHESVFLRRSQPLLNGGWPLLHRPANPAAGSKEQVCVGATGREWSEVQLIAEPGRLGREVAGRRQLRVQYTDHRWPFASCSDDDGFSWTAGRWVPAGSNDGGRSWKRLTLVEPGHYHGYCHASFTFQGDRVHLTCMRVALFSSRCRFDVRPGHNDRRCVALPISWFHRDARGS